MLRKNSQTPVSEILAKSVQEFEATEKELRVMMRPCLKGIEESNWQTAHSYLLEILVQGNEVTNRMSLYREIGRINQSAAKQICKTLESQIDTISLFQHSIEDKSTDSQKKLLTDFSLKSEKLLMTLKGDSTFDSSLSRVFH